MADIQYLNYGDQQIEQQALLNNLANNVQQYVQNQSWSKKRKDKFMSAYSDLMNKGILGASNNTGQWMIDVNGVVDLDSMDKKDKEMYGEVAYFIQQQMAGLPTKSSQEEKKEEDKSKLPVFDNDYFTKEFQNHISSTLFGGREFDTQNDWNSLDKREENGLRGKTNRATKLADLLQSYSDSLEENKHNFEGSPFKDLSEFKGKVQEAITALRNPNESDDIITEKLNAIGINSRDYFNNGSGDLSDKINPATGEHLTYAELAQFNQQEAEKKQQQQQLQQEQAQKKAYDNTLFFTRGSAKLQGRNPQELKAKYGADDKLRQALFQYSQQDIRRLTPDEQSEIHGAYRYLAKDPIDGELLKKLQSSSSGLYKNAAPNRFRKINGINNLIWDSAAGQVIQIQTRDQYNANKNQPQDLFKGVKTQEELNKEKDKAQQQYLNNTEWTADQTRELMGIAADVASVVDPEPFTAGGLALTGTGLRTYNRATDADGFTWSDAGHTALDAGLSLLGMIPVVGDAALAARVVGKLQKAAGWLGAAFAAASVPQAAKAAWNKVVNGQDMTVDDWRAIGNVLMGATQARRIQLNRAAGNAVKNQGGTTAKEKVGEVEVKVNGKTEKVEIDEASAKELQQAYKAAGSDQKATTEALRKSRKVREQLEAKKTSDGKPAYTKEQLDAMEAPQAASGSVRGHIPGAHDTRGIKITERSVQTSGTPVSELNLGPLAQMRINAVQNNTGWFNRGDFGWNMRGGNSEQQSSGWLSRMWQNLKNPYKPKTQKQQETPKQETTQQETQQPQQQTTREQQFDRATINRYKETVLNRNNKPTDQRFSKRNITDGEYNIGGEQVTIKKEADGTFSLTSNSGKYELRKKSQNEIKEMVASIVKSQRKSVDQQGKVTKKSTKEIGKILQDLKRKGWLKEGGKLTDSEVDNFLKQYK